MLAYHHSAQELSGEEPLSSGVQDQPRQALLGRDLVGGGELLRRILLLQILSKTCHCVNALLGHFLELKTDGKAQSHEHYTL